MEVGVLTKLMALLGAGGGLGEGVGRVGQLLWAFQALKSINTLFAQVSYHLQPVEF